MTALPRWYLRATAGLPLWYVRDARTGKLLIHPKYGATIATGDIDYALATARRRFYHDVTVDNLAPRPGE